MLHKNMTQMETNINEPTVSKRWWSRTGGFFGDVYLEGDNSFEGFLKSPMDLETRTKAEVEGVRKLCELRSGDKILDCPSGYGRHSIALNRMGFDVTGVDVNDKYIKTANSVSKGLNLTNMRFQEKDMRHVNFKNGFAAVINMFYSFGFFDSEEDNFKAIKNFYKALKPGGKFLMHTHITLPKILNGDYRKHEIRTLKTGNKLELFRGYNPETKREYGQWSVLYLDGTKKTSPPYSMRIYSKEEFIKICKKVGFKKVDVFGNWNEAKYTDKSPLMIVVATK